MALRRRILVQAFACCPPGREGFSGGEDLLGWRVIEQLAAAHEVWVLTYAGHQAAIEQAVGRAPLPGARFHYVALPGLFTPWLRWPGLHQAYYYFWQFAAARAARRLHAAVGFELTHLVTYANDWMGCPLGVALPVPYVRGPGGGAQQVPEACLAEFSWSARFWERVRAVGQRLFRRDPVFRRSQALARALLLCNRASLDAVPPAWRAKAQLFPVNGISEEELALFSQPPAERPTGFTIVSAGKLLRLKGFPLVIKAVHRLAQQHSDVRLDIIGDGPDRPALVRLIRALGMERHVRIRPWMPRPEFLAALRACDVFLFASLRDGGGAVVLEAMAAGKPVVCLDLGGPGLHVTEVCGFRVPSGTPAECVAGLAEAVQRLYDDPALRQRMGQAARMRAEGEYRWDRLGQRLLDIYAAVLGEPSQRPRAGATEERVHALR